MIQTITKLELSDYLGTTVDIYNDIKLKNNFTITSSKLWNKRNTSSRTIVSELNEFQPQEMELSFYMTDSDYFEFIRRINFFNHKFTMTIHYIDRKKMCDIILEETSIAIENNVGTLKKVIMKCLRITDFYENKIYKYTPNIADSVDNGYDYEFDFIYSEVSGNSTEGAIEIFNNGTKDAFIRFEITPKADSAPSVGVDKVPTSTKNSYICTDNLTADSVLINDSRQQSKEILLFKNNAYLEYSQNRVFTNSYGYLFIPVGKHKIIFRNTESAMIYLEERSSV